MNSGSSAAVTPPLGCLYLAAIFLLLTACGTGHILQPAAGTDESLLRIDSRGQRIPATVTLPRGEFDALPLVVMAHGHGGSRSEAGGFDRLAAQLARQGIASIRMDFPGCGDSVESFSANNLSNMLQDVAAARDYMVSNYPVDTDRIAVHGYSMGARIALLSSRNHRWVAISNWAPVTADGADSMLVFMNGQESWDALRATAEAEGQATFVTPFGQSQTLGRRWFSDLAASRPLHTAATYSGPVLALCGKHDAVAPVASCQDLQNRLDMAEVEAHTVETVHGFGFYSGDPAIGDEVLRLTVRFLLRHMR